MSKRLLLTIMTLTTALLLAGAAPATALVDGIIPNPFVESPMRDKMIEGQNERALRERKYEQRIHCLTWRQNGVLHKECWHERRY